MYAYRATVLRQVPFFVATGASAALVDFYTARDQLSDALLIAQVAVDGGFDAISTLGKPATVQPLYVGCDCVVCL
jgi:hypothetical protein